MGTHIRRLTLVALVSVFALSAGKAEELTLLTPAGGCPQTLSAPGEYLLTGDLACAGTVSGIVIDSPNVTLHLGGHTISNTACDLNVGFGGIFVMNNVA